MDQVLADIVPIFGKVVVFLFALAAFVFALWFGAKLVSSLLPARVAEQAQQAFDLTTELRAEMDLLRNEWTSTIETLLDVSDQLETRRKRVQQQATRLERAGGQKEVPESSAVQETIEQASIRLGVGRY